MRRNTLRYFALRAYLGLLNVSAAGPVTVKLAPSTTGKVSADAVRALPVTAAATSAHYVFTDHLYAPRVITRASDNQMVWRWDNADPFGLGQPDPNPAGLATNFTYNPRFPGQVFDAETGLYYNYHRHYSPAIGGYTQPDPIGLDGGQLNLYAYVGGNPVNDIDPQGLHGIVFVRPWWIVRPIGSPWRWFDSFRLPKPPVDQPKPPGWNPDWEWKCPEAINDSPRWFDPKGGEWRWHEDQRHIPHWDFNPWETWNSEWRNVSPYGNEMLPGTSRLYTPTNSTTPTQDFPPECYASGMCM
jgi:RHS repeat-associated protein